jgi:hypothetical protein
MLEGAPESAIRLPPGARVLDSWRRDERGAVLFWVDRELDLWGHGHAVLHHLELQRVDGAWRGRGGGGGASLTASEILAETGLGLHCLGGASSDSVRLTWAIASPEVASIELRTQGSIRSRHPGHDGFCLLGSDSRDSITYAHALDTNGRPLAGEPLLL